MLPVVPDLSAVLPAGEASPVIEQIVREGARQVLAAALQAEVAAYMDQFARGAGREQRVGAAPLARGQRPAPGRARPGRGSLRQRQAGRTTRRPDAGFW